MLMAGADAHGASKEDTYPSRPIKVIVPFGAGGGSDTFVRIIQRQAPGTRLPLIIDRQGEKSVIIAKFPASSEN